MKDSIPLYGMIPYFGGEWTVIFEAEIRPEGNTTSSLRGYGEFPRDRFPNIPVINLRGCEAVSQFLRIRNNDYPGEQDTKNGGTLESFLTKVRALGIPVLMPAGEKAGESVD